MEGAGCRAGLAAGTAATPRRRRPIFVHAGLRPGVPFAEQSLEDRLCIRRPFLDSAADFGAIVVHGHTPTRAREPERHANRVNLDTGAVYGGPLTCGVFEGDRLYFLAAP